MKLMSPLKAPARNTEQRIFKYIVFVVLPLMAILTISSFIYLNEQKDNAVHERIEIQSGNANKRITLFFDPIHRDLRYLQARANTKARLDPHSKDDVKDFLGRFSEFYLQNVKQVILYSQEDVWVYSINEGDCKGPAKVIDGKYKKYLDETLQANDFEVIKWFSGTFDRDDRTSSILAAMLFKNPKSNKTNAVAVDVNTTDFFSGLENHIQN
ncbi:MAG: hypothetical protein ACO3BO_00580, partial [Anaerohalosphaeraceae bacterium]